MKMILICYIIGIFLCALLVTRLANTAYAVFSLILVFLQVSCVLFYLGVSEFIGILLLLVYVGAVTILFLFVVMMVDTNYQVILRQNSKQNQSILADPFILFSSCILIIAQLNKFVHMKYLLSINFYVQKNLLESSNLGTFGDPEGTSINFLNLEYFSNDINMLGELLYQDWNTLFYLITVLLTLTLIGAISICLDNDESNK